MQDISRIRPIKSILRIKKEIYNIEPDIVHLHSTFAGFYGRILGCKIKTGCAKCESGVKIKRFKIVYSPHCYAFERKDINRILKLLFFFTEKILSIKTAGYALCSKREESLTRSKIASFSKNIKIIPNVFNSASRINTDSHHLQSTKNLSVLDSIEQDDIVIAMCGRISKQKNPLLFIEIKNELQKISQSKYKFVWIGGEIHKMKNFLNLLIQNDIIITNWLEPLEIDRMFKRINIYLHTALWEGFPISILQANSFQIPIIAYKQSYLEGYPETWQFQNQKAAAEIIRSIEISSSTAQNCVNDWNHSLIDNTNNAQKIALNEFYEAVCTP